MKKSSFISDHQQKRKFRSTKLDPNFNSTNKQGSIINNKYNDLYYSTNFPNYNHNSFKMNNYLDDRVNTDASNNKDKAAGFLSSGGLNSGLATNDNSLPKSTIITGKRSPESPVCLRKKKAVNYCNLVNTNNIKQINKFNSMKQTSKEKSFISKSISKSRSKSPFNKIGIIDEEEININIPQPYPQNVSFLF